MLFIAALLFYFLRHKETTLPPKPSQYDFTETNHVQEQIATESPPPGAQAGTQAPAPPLLPAPQLGDAVASLNPSDKKAWQTLTEIIQSKNDNDPRLDHELKNTSPELHRAFFETYSQLAPENRNGRGTIAFLVARDLKSQQDFDFIEKIFQEEPCLNLADCKVSAPDTNPHTSGMDQTTLNYPQLASLYQLSQQLGSRPELLQNPAYRENVLNILKTAENYPVPAVRNKAREIREHYKL